MEERKTIAEWGEQFGVQVMDPDGFNRRDPHLHRRKFTLLEFNHGYLRSTIMARSDLLALGRSPSEMSRMLSNYVPEGVLDDAEDTNQDK